MPEGIAVNALLLGHVNIVAMLQGVEAVAEQILQAGLPRLGRCLALGRRLHLICLAVVTVRQLSSTCDTDVICQYASITVLQGIVVLLCTHARHSQCDPLPGILRLNGACTYLPCCTRCLTAQHLQEASAKCETNQPNPALLLQIQAHSHVRVAALLVLFHVTGIPTTAWLGPSNSSPHMQNEAVLHHLSILSPT